MKTYCTLLICMFFVINTTEAQLLINELDVDNPGIDTEEFIELKSVTPYFSLDGYVLVFYNGNPTSSTGNKSYFTIDLDGFQTDVNGLIVLGNNGVSPVPDEVFADNTIQNGEDAVAIYQADASDFPDQTAVTNSDLIDALVYGKTNANEATTLMNALGENEQVDIGAGNNTTSVQRDDNGDFYQASPTPKAHNDGSGIIPVGIEITVDESHKNEGDSFMVDFTTENPVADSDLTIEFTLSNGNFNANDFSGTTTVTIPQGQHSATTMVQLTTDGIEEGDEEMKISFIQPLQEGYVRLNDNIIVRVIDNDYQVAAWGTPVSPTYSEVNSTQPVGYYNSLDELSGGNLKAALQAIIANPNKVRAQTYAEVYELLKEADQNPANSSQVWLVYTEEGRSKLDVQATSQNTGTWNREHVYPRSRGGFYSIEADEVIDGKDVFWTTNADSLRHANSDAHAIRAVDGPENSSRGNQFYGLQAYTGPNGNLGSFKGDVARSIFYLVIRYNDLEVVNGYPDGNIGEFGDLATLLDWHRNDPPDDYEMNRNNVIYEWQKNRNPFIDQPDLVEYLWGNQQGETWEQELHTDARQQDRIGLYPNPTKTMLNLTGIEQGKLTIFTMQGQPLKHWEVTAARRSFLLPELAGGTYIVILTDSITEKQYTRKLLIAE